jgi:hypothetical protein
MRRHHRRCYQTQFSLQANFSAAAIYFASPLNTYKMRGYCLIPKMPWPCSKACCGKQHFCSGSRAGCSTLQAARLLRFPDLTRSALDRRHGVSGIHDAVRPISKVLIVLPIIAIWLVFFQNRVTVQLNMNECENGQPLAKPTVRSRISSERWEQIKTAYAAGIGLREIARKMNIPEGTVLVHAKRHGWTQQIQVAKQQQSDAITQVQSVPRSLVAILSERKDRIKLGLGKYAAEAAERAGESDGNLRLSRNVRDVSAVGSSL